MKPLVLGSFVLALITAAQVGAQTPGDFPGPPLSPPAPLVFKEPLPPAGPPVPIGTQTPPLTPPIQPQLQASHPQAEDGPREFWMTLDYLLWWSKAGPNPNTLVTVGSVNDPVAGGLGQPGTQVIFGGHNVDFGALSGIRVYGGWWLPCCPVLGLEAGFLTLGQNSQKVSAFSDPNGSPVIARPFINALDSSESAYIDSYPGMASGGVTVRFSTEFDSWELNMAVNMLHYRNFSWDLQGGFRAVDLVEDLQIRDVLEPLTPGAFTFRGGPADPPNLITDFDHIRTTNHFYGGQIGSRMQWEWCRWNLGMTAKVALGVTQEAITVDGSSSLLSPGNPAFTTPGGIFALSSNMGRVHRNIFTVVPEAGFNLGYQFTPHIGMQFGYTFLYWSNVVRPGSQVDRTVNPTLVPTDQSYGNFTGPARPGLTPQSTDYWTQGINVGLTFRF
ncbi:MAG TPA: BBP7 family outer membrane beta-barrel protein [Gemmataceae bacterium]|nr:BBP7 family outer membrane beta-barrel protein [Gemmataceae bacterium]